VSVEVDAGYGVPGLGERDGQATRPDGELEDRSVGAVSQG
jgi:hypothetical protein